MAEQKRKLKSGTEIRRCTCQHEYQDKRYGKQMRVHNYCEKGLRCTVCGKIN